MPDLSCSSLHVVPDFPSMLFSYLFTTSSPLPLLFVRSYSVVWQNLLVVPALGGEFSAHSCNSCRLSCLEVTRGLGENGRNFLCNVGATQPIGIFLSPPSRKSTQLCGFAIFSTLFVMVHAIDLLHTPISVPLHPSFPSLFGRVVCLYRVCGVPLIHYFLSHRHILRPYPRSFLPIFPLPYIHPSSCYIFPACYCLHLIFLKFL